MGELPQAGVEGAWKASLIPRLLIWCVRYKVKLHRAKRWERCVLGRGDCKYKGPETRERRE